MAHDQPLPTPREIASRLRRRGAAGSSNKDVTRMHTSPPSLYRRKLNVKGTI
jgi:hypothetical protein